MQRKIWFSLAEVVGFVGNFIGRESGESFAQFAFILILEAIKAEPRAESR
jgi:hypothetical protein